MLVLYDAGFEELPQCLLQLFCDLIHVIYNKNNCDCHACATCQDNSDSGFIANETMTTDELVESYLNKLVIDSYRKQLGLISLCGKSLEQIWGLEYESSILGVREHISATGCSSCGAKRYASGLKTEKTFFLPSGKD